MCNICKTRFLYRHHLKLHRCRIRNARVFKCHLCSQTFVQCLSLAHHLRRGHQYFAKRKVKSTRSSVVIGGENIEVTERKVHKKKEDRSQKGQQKILLKIKAGTSTTLISPGKEITKEKDKKLKSSHMKHKRKKAKRKLDIMQPAVSVKNGLILKIRPVLKPETEKILKKHSKSRTKLKHENNENIPIQQSHGLKLKIRTEQGKGHVVLNSEAEQKVPKLLVSKKNLDNVHKSLNKLSGSVLTSKNIVRKYKNQKNVHESVFDNDTLELENITEEGDKLVPRVKNGIIIHKDRLGNYTSAEQIVKTDSKATDIPKCAAGVWKVDASEKTKTSKSKKHDVPKFAKGIWEVMPSPRPDGTPDLLKIRLSPQKPPPRLETNPDILYETTKLFGMDARSKADTVLSEDSDTFGASPATEKDLELGINSVHDSGIEVLSSSSCNRSNGNSVRSVLLDENSPTYYQDADSLMSFDSPGNDSSKYEHSICGKCGGIVMEQNNNTYSPTKCHCDLNSPSQDFQEKAGYIYISPLKSPSIHKKTSPKYKLNDKNTTVSVSPLNILNGTELCEKSSVNESTSLFHDESKIENEKSVFDFNEDEDFSVKKPLLDHVKNPRVLNKTEEEKKQESILLGDLQESKEPVTPRKRTRNKLSRSPRRKPAKDISEKSELMEISPGRKVGLTPSKPIIIEDESPVSKDKDVKLTCTSKKADKLSEQKYLLGEGKEIEGINDYGFHLKNKVVDESSKSIIVGIAKNDKVDEKEPVKSKQNKIEMDRDENIRNCGKKINAASNAKSENEKATVSKPDGKYALKNGKTCNAQNSDSDIGNNHNESLNMINDSDIIEVNDDNGSEEHNAKTKEAEKEDNEQDDKTKEKTKEADSKVNGNDPLPQSFDETSQKLIEYLEAKGISDEVPVLCSANNDSGVEEIHLYTKGCSNDLIKSVQSFVKEAEEVTGNEDQSNVKLGEGFEIKSPVESCTSMDLETMNVVKTKNLRKETLKEKGLEKDIENDVDETSKDEIIVSDESDLQESTNIDTCIENEQIEKCVEKETMQKSNSEDSMVDKVIEQLESESESEIKESKLLKPFVEEPKDLEKKKIKPPPVVLKDFDEDSLLQVPVPDETDLTAALEHAGLGVKTTVVMNPDEDIPEVSNSAKPSSSSIIKSPLDLFQQQFLSFLSHKSPDPEERKTKTAKRTKRKASNNKKQKTDPKEPQKSAGTKNPTSSVGFIDDGSSDSDFEVSGPKSKKRRKSSPAESNMANPVSKSEGKQIEKTKSVTANMKGGSGHRKASSSNIIIVKSPNLEDDIQIELPQPDSDSDFKPHTEDSEQKNKSVKKTSKTHNRSYNREDSEDDGQIKKLQEDSDKDFEPHDHDVKHMKKSVVKNAPKTSSVNQKHKDFGSDDSDFVLSDSELERAVLSDSDFEDPFEPKVKRLKSCRQRRESLRQKTISFNEDDENSKDSKDDHQAFGDTQASEIGDRSKRTKRGRKSICPCCIGSPGMHRREHHEYKLDYKLPKNHKQFVADTIRLLELKAKIHRLFLSLFPSCKELITQSDINTIAFDDLIDDVLSTLKTDIQFEPGSDIFAEPDANVSHVPSFKQTVDEDFQQVVGDTVQQLVDETVHYESLEDRRKSAFETEHQSENLSCMVTDGSAVVFVPNVHLVYSDDSVVGTSQMPAVDQLSKSDSTETASNLLPILTTYNTNEVGNSKSEAVIKEQIDNEPDMHENSENDVSNKAEESLTTEENQSFLNNDNVNSEFSSLESDNQINAPLEPGANELDFENSVSQQNNSVVTSDDNFINNIDTSNAVPALMNTDPACSSTEPITGNMVNEIQTVESEPSGVMSETNCEEIVITIDLNAAKVQLCRSPTSCLKLLHLKIVRLIWCLLPDLQVSAGVYESLENLEFLLDLIIMSNSSADENNKLLSKMASTLKMKHSSTKRTENCSNSLPTGKRGRPGRKPLLRRQSELSVREMTDRKQARIPLKRRSKSTDKAVLMKKLKSNETSSENKHHRIIHKSPLKHAKSSDVIKLKKSAPAISSSRRNSTGKLIQPSKVTDAKIIGAVAKKYSRTTHSDSVNVVRGMPEGDKVNVQLSDKYKSLDKKGTGVSGIDTSIKISETRENRSLFELEFENSIGVTKDIALNGKLEGDILKGASCAPRVNDRGGNIFEKMESRTVERSEGNIFEILDSVKTDRNNSNILKNIEAVESERNEILTSPINVSLTSPVRTPSPEKSVGSFSPDMKRRSSDKNIFDLLQET